MAVMVDEAALGGFDALPGGPALAAEVDAADPATLSGEQAAAWMRAAFRVRNHGDWQLLVAIREASSARADTTDRAGLDEFAPKIAAANLGWSAAAASTKLDLAVGVLERMPALGERMRQGELELTKAASFVTGLDGLTDAQCAEVLAKLLDEAPDLPVGQLRDRILAAGYAVDRLWGANRLAAATARARVSTETAPSGAVNVCGRDLDPDLAQDAKHRLRALALAIRRQLRALGHRRALGFIEARVFVRLMDGTLAGADDTAVIDAVTTELATTAGPDDSGPDDSGPDDSGPGSDPGDEHLYDDGSDDGSGNDGGPGSEPDRERSDDPAADGTAADGGPECPGGAFGPQRSVVFAPEIAVRLPLSTLLGLDDTPGVLPGTGPVPGGTARAAALRRGAANWQVLVHDDHGRLIHLLGLRAPPDAARDPRHRRQTVQLTASAALLHALVLDPSPDQEHGAGEGGPVELGRAREVLLDEATTTWLRRARDALHASEHADPDDHPATTTRDRDRRFPGARLAAWVIARDQTCVTPGCTRPAETCDLDHTIDWLLGGATEAGDLEALCRHDHRGKHHGGWTYQQPSPGRFVITDPTGTRHHVQSRVVHPLPAPVQPGRALTPDLGPPPPDRGDWAPRRTRDGRITRKAHDTATRLARRARRQQHQPPGRYDHDPDF